MSRRLMATILAGVLAAVGLTTAPAHAAAPRQPSCDPGDCFTVDVSLDRAPAVGQSARLTVVVTPKQDIPDATTIIELPDTLKWTTPPAGFTHDTATVGRSPVDRATSRAERVKKGRTIRYEAVVAAERPGPASIRVQARDGRPGPGTEGLAYLTIGTRSIFGMPADDRARGVRIPARRSDLPGDTCVHGRITHVVAETGALRGVPKVLVETFDVDADGSEQIGWTVTDDTGDYRVCFDGVEEDGTGQDVYVEVTSTGDYWGVVKPADGTNYLDRSEVRPDIPRGTALSVIDYQAAPGSPIEGAFRLFTAAHDTWKAYTGWLDQPGDGCWETGSASCRRVLLVWAPDRAVPGGSYYCSRVAAPSCPREFEAHLTASAQLRKMEIAHELGHFIMDYTYGHLPPMDPSCRAHYMMTPMATKSCAWVEGWADWVAVQTYGDTHFRWATGGLQDVDLESPRWYSAGWPSGPDADRTEGRVAGALLDLADSGARDEKYWDVAGIGPEGVVAAFRNVAADDLDQFLLGLDVRNQALAEQVLFQNTIRVSRLSALLDRSPARWPTNVPQEELFTVPAGRWAVAVTSAVAADGTDVNLDVVPQAAGKPPVTSEDWAANPDFVAVQPPVADESFTAWAGSPADYQEYALEVAQAPDGDLEKGSPQELAMAADRLVEIRTVRLEQGVPATLTVTPRNGQDVDLFVMTPNPAVWGQPRSAARRAASGGAGKAERITISDPRTTGVYAVVVIKKSGEGTVSLARS
ncbi:hypothetical protein ACIBK9_12400 [Nonomuraea sp. NPDC050227]|uniref:hypothetical protein n=1 Tax=Nonomuraea sp. NPDC050227 TaxID=3364360 RepID=UPI0037AA69DD